MSKKRHGKPETTMTAAPEIIDGFLKAVTEWGIESPDQLRDILFDYDLSQGEIRELHRRYIEAAPPTALEGINYCPECGGRLPTSAFYRSFHCGRCGKKIQFPITNIWRNQP